MDYINKVQVNNNDSNDMMHKYQIGAKNLPYPLNEIEN